MVLYAVSRASWFSWASNALSDLGVGETAAIFNTGLIAAGLIAMIFGIGLGRFIFTDRAGRAGVLALLFSCLALVSIGVFPESAGRIHYWVSVAFFVSLPIAMFIMAGAMVIDDFKKNLSYVALTVCLAFVAAIPWGLPHDGVAIPEIVSSVAGSAWFVSFGIRMLKDAD
ncbi:MAG: DUF998 domain-containing protein [Theionarchaea archaeon]|nr:DUF998 domain-containing protein [Theionarchaea archaeon]